MVHLTASSSTAIIYCIGFNQRDESPLHGGRPLRFSVAAAEVTLCQILNAADLPKEVYFYAADTVRF